MKAEIETIYNLKDILQDEMDFIREACELLHEKRGTEASRRVIIALEGC